MSEQLYAYIWYDTCNADYGAGDVVVVARNLEEAREVAKKHEGKEHRHGQNRLECSVDHFTPDVIVKINPEKGFAYFGLGSA